MKNSKRILIMILLAGIAVFAVGLFYVADIPYQDPTPEMLREFNKKMIIGGSLCLGGGIIILFDIIGWITYYITHFKNSRKILIIALLAGTIAFAAGVCFGIVAKILYQYPHPDHPFVRLNIFLCLGDGFAIFLDIIGWIIYVFIHSFNKNTKKEKERPLR